MTFFDKKEEVMKIQLTPYGRYLLSIGKLVPHSYRFFDEDITYDSTAMGITEKQNEAHKRITEETPKKISNPNVTGVETNLRKFETSNITINNIRVPSTDDVINTNNESIGTNDYKSNKGASFEVQMYRGDLLHDSISNTYTSTNIDSAPIPQVPIAMYFSSSIKVNSSFTYMETTDEFEIAAGSFSDDSYFSIKEVQPLLKIIEKSSFDETDNFLLTAYKIETVNDTTMFKSLKVPRRMKKVINDLLINQSDLVVNVDDVFESAFDDDGEEQTLLEDDVTSDLSYYIDLTFDREIPNEEICSTVGELEIRNIFLDDEVNCPDAMDDEEYDIYRSRVTDADIEDCD